MTSPDPLAPRIYPAEVPFVEPPRPAAGSTTVPWQLRLPGAAVPWGPACFYAFCMAAVACLMQFAHFLIGGPPFRIFYCFLATPWMMVHLSRPRRRWWALAAASPIFVITGAVSGFLQVLLLVALVATYTAITHIPIRGGSVPTTARYVPVPVDQPRRAAGTLSLTDVARSFFTNRANPRPEDDLVDLGRGMTLHVAARTGRKRGRLVLGPEDLAWQPHRWWHGYGTEVRLDAMLSIDVVKPGSRKAAFPMVAITTGVDRREFTVTQVDVELLRAYGSRVGAGQVLDTPPAAVR